MVKIKGRNLELLVLPAILIVLLLLPHLLFFNNGYVDLEIYCVEAASDIARHGVNADLADYFATIANPLFSVFILAGSYLIFGESPFVSRFTIFLLALLFTMFLYFYVRGKKGGAIAFLLALLVVVNPMFIVYSQYVYSDVPFMIFAAVALLLLLCGSSLKGNVVSAIMLGVSLATKYVAAVLFPLAFVYNVIKSGIWRHFSGVRLLALVRFNLWYFALSFLVSLPVILIVLHYQGTIIPSKYESSLALGINMLLVPRIFSYMLWLGLFVGPLCIITIIDLWEKAGRKKFLFLLSGLIVLTLAVHYFFPVASLHVQTGIFGEMNLGWVESVVPSLYLSVAFFFVILVAELFIAGMIFGLKHADDGQAGNMLLWIVLVMILMSFTRVANRYLLVLLVPISWHIVHIVYRMYFEGKFKRRLVKAVLPLHAVIFLAVGVYSNYYLYLRGIAG
ncbi:glycosyltransferase family 39 protein [Chloroflexota bacterium]